MAKKRLISVPGVYLLIKQHGDLFGQQSNKKYQQGGKQKHCTHISKTTHSKISIEIMYYPGGKYGRAYRYEYL